MSWSKLTQLSGEVVYVQDHRIVFFRKAMVGEFPCKVGAVLELEGYGKLPVLEDCATMIEGPAPDRVPFYAMAYA